MTSMTSTLGPHTVDHHMTRVDIPTGMVFDTFCDAFEQAVPVFDFAHIRDITENGGTWQDIAAASSRKCSQRHDAIRDARHDRALRDHRPSHKGRRVLRRKPCDRRPDGSPGPENLAVRALANPGPRGRRRGCLT